MSPILKIDKIVYPGRSMALDQGKVVFTDRGLPGEKVEVEILRDRKSFAEGRTLRVVEKSATRVEPRCGHYLACSPYQDMEYGAQLEVKKGQVEEIFGRELKLKFDALTMTPSPEIWGYRNRIRLRVLWEDGKARAYYHEPGEETAFLPVDRCFLVSDRVNDLLAELVGFLSGEAWEAVSGLEIRESRSRGRLLAVFHLESASRIEEMAGKLQGLHHRFPLSGIVGLVRDGNRIREVTLGGVARLEESVKGVIYRIGAQSFFQVNVGILEKVFDDMSAAAVDFAGSGIADLYSGVGTFGMFLAKDAREVFGVEPDRANISFLKRNMNLNKASNFNVCEGTSEEWLPSLLEREIGIVILDPPRRGVDPGMLRELAARPVPLVLYLSCNPTTLARDLKILLPVYEIRGLEIYDFFPHTPHIEALAVLLNRGHNTNFRI
ncbi:MAG: 23S rRNA (uracil(1939)-C(5))-methyltransferase RlmD [Candidatus Aminicenantales bacterium]